MFVDGFVVALCCFLLQRITVLLALLGKQRASSAVGSVILLSPFAYPVESDSAA